MSSSQEQTPCINPELTRTCCCHNKEDTTPKEELELSLGSAVEPTLDQAIDMDPIKLDPAATDAHVDEQTSFRDLQKPMKTAPVTAPKQCAPKCKYKARATLQPGKQRLPKAVFQYYLQFGFTPKAVHAILHSPPKDLTNKKVSFVPVTPPKNC